MRSRTGDPTKRVSVGRAVIRLRRASPPARFNCRFTKTPAVDRRGPTYGYRSDMTGTERPGLPESARSAVLANRYWPVLVVNLRPYTVGAADFQNSSVYEERIETVRQRRHDIVDVMVAVGTFSDHALRVATPTSQLAFKGTFGRQRHVP